MEYCQRDTFGNIIPQTWIQSIIGLIIDTSGSMGTYSPEIVERAVNRFFNTIAESQDANALIQAGVLESYSSVDVIADFTHINNLRLHDIRPGGLSKLPTAVSIAFETVNEYRTMLEQQGCVCMRPLIIIISDGSLNQNQPEDLFWLTETIKTVPAHRQPRLLLFTNNSSHLLIRRIPELETNITPAEQLESALSALANELITAISPQQTTYTWGDNYNTSTRKESVYEPLF